MKGFLGRITLSKNARGCWILDTVKGCILAHSRKGGCYGDCYALKIAGRYGIDFSNPVKRGFDPDEQASLFGFENEEHTRAIVRSIRDIDMPFVRIGEMGDPSHDWEHTVSVCESIQDSGKPIVIITKHIRELSDEQCERLSKMDVCVNTSTSAMDDDRSRKYRIGQFERIKKYCKSVLRIVSCDFNEETERGSKMKSIQDSLFMLYPTLETVFRPSKDNEIVASGTIRVSNVMFLNAPVVASMRHGTTYFGKCDICPEMCGINI